MRKTYSKGDKVYLVHRAANEYTLGGKTCLNTVSGPFVVAETTPAHDTNEGTLLKVKVSLHAEHSSEWRRVWTVFTSFDEARRYCRYLGTIVPNYLNSDLLRLSFETDKAELHRRGIIDTNV